jgi:hypothetical protein
MRPPRRATVAGLDVLAVALLVLTAAIFQTGGFVFNAGAIRVSLTSTHRTLVALVILLIYRFVRAPRDGPFGRATATWQRVIDTIEREPLIVRAAPGAWTRGGVAALGIAAALAVLLHQQLRHLDSVPDFGDPLFSIWRVAWVAHQIVTNPPHLFDANIFYPERLTLTLSDPVLLPALSVSPLLALGIHPVVVYNLLLMSGFWLSGVATYVLVERLTGSARAAFIAGLSYACVGFRFDHYSHLELQMTEWMPLALLALHLFVSTKRWPYAVALALAGVAQLYSSMYYAVFLLVYAAAIGVGLVLAQQAALRPLLRPLIIAAFVAALLAWPLVRAFSAAEPMKGARELYEVEFYSASPSDFLRVNRYSAMWRDRLPPPAPERTLFPGLAPLALAAVAVAPPLGTLRLIYLAGLLVAVDGAFGLHGVAYPYYYLLLSPFRGLRSPARFGALVALSLSILAGFGVQRILRRTQSRTYQQTTFAALVVLVMLDAWPALSLVPVWRQAPPTYDALASNAVLVEAPLPEKEIGNVPFMYFSAWHWTRLVNGYSGFIPASYKEFNTAMLGFPDATSIEALRQRGATHVSINCGVGDWDRCEAVAKAARGNQALRLVTETLWMQHTVQLYEIVNP